MLDTSIRDLLRMEQAQQDRWMRTPIPAWHPRNETQEPAAPPPEPDPSDTSPGTPRYEEIQASYTRSQQELARLRKIEEDEEEYRRIGAEKFGFQFQDPEPEPEPEYEPESAHQFPPEVQERLNRIEAQQQRQEQNRFESDFKSFVGGRELSPHGERAIRTTPNLNSPDDLKKAVEEWFEYEQTLRGPTRRDAPTPPPAGKAGEADPNKIKDPAARRTARRARIAAQVEAGMQQQ